MNESKTISKLAPALESMDYELLREIGIRHIQELAGKLWTDYNTHDPGITILEVLSYVLTDIGYRINYDIKDILAQKLGSPDVYDIKNFYTAGRILPVCPVTFNDFREIMMDVEVVDNNGSDPQYYGVKNAWIHKSPDAEHAIYVNQKKSELSLAPIPNAAMQKKFYVKTLYDVLLEFDKNTDYGDLNENTIAGDYILYEFPALPILQGMKIAVRISFPSWDDPVDWTDYTEVRKAVRNVRLKFFHMANGYGLTYDLAQDKKVVLSVASNSKPIPAVDNLITQLNHFLYDPTAGLIVKYMEKMALVHMIVEEVKINLHRNRNLCDDFFRVSALKVEEILLCADIELDNLADVEETEAAIFYAISTFLSPTVYFYTLEEMLNKCAMENTYGITAISPGENTITINAALKEDVGNGDTVSITGDEVLAGEFTVNCIRENQLNPAFTDIHIEEEIASDTFSEEAVLFVGKLDENLCLTVDKIFEGPKLSHGFIDDKELEAAQLTKVIHVSDLIRIIMDVQGVKAVRNIQIANKPQDNDDGIEEKSVKWCLDLAWEHNYVPRLSLDKSKITFYKDQLPFLANDEVVGTLINDLEAADRPQKIRYPKMDIDPPLGAFKDIENYVSLQEEFPDIYGVGSSGIPNLSSLKGLKKSERLGKVKQLKAFLTFFDQLIANELAQLNSVKDLFSMNGDKNAFGEYKIDRTYFSKPLHEVIPNASTLYMDAAGHQETLKGMVESEELYIKRRNKFLDHLLGRFAETFTDYAILVHKVNKDTAGLDLIEDKLQFLDRYPAISAERGKGFNYLQPYCQWHIGNISGVEQRASFLLGIREKELATLNFGPNFSINTSGGYSIADDAAVPLLVQKDSLEDETAVKELMEGLIMVGLYRENYTILPAEGGKFFFQLNGEDGVLGISAKNDYDSDTAGGDADTAITQLMAILKKEYFENYEANRKNLGCPTNNYFTYSLTADTSPVAPNLPTYSLDYVLYSKAFNFSNPFEILHGKITEEVVLEETETLPLTEEQVLKKGGERIAKLLWEVVHNALDRERYVLDAALSPYRFQLYSKKGILLGASSEKDFNSLLADQIKNSTDPMLQILGSTSNDGLYTIMDTNAIGPNLEIELAEALPSPIFDGEAIWEEAFGLQEVNSEDRYVKADADIGANFMVGDLFEIRGSQKNDGVYTIREISDEGGKTILGFWEPIFSEVPDGEIIDTHVFTMVGISGNTVTVVGGEDEKAIGKLIGFIKERFFNKEGMHLIEHTLLRPRINEELFLPLESRQLVSLGSSTAQLIFPKRSDIVKVDSSNNTLMVSDNLKAEIVGQSIYIENGPYDGMELGIVKITTQGGKSKLKVKEDLKFDLPKLPFQNGTVRYSVQTAITKIKPITKRITVGDASAMALIEGDRVRIENPGNDENEGQYTVGMVEENGSELDITLVSKLQWVIDDLLPIHLDQDCEACQIMDVYSCIATVIFPYWADRFIDLDFRKFVEKTLRLETPAHILLNVCWVNCEQMEALEHAYKSWLLEINRPVGSKSDRSVALNNFIKALSKSRNIYPTGTLHSCDEEESLEGAIILNNSVLGT